MYGLINTIHEKHKFSECVELAKEFYSGKKVLEETIQDKATWYYLRYKAQTDLFFLGYHILDWKTPKKNKTFKRRKNGMKRIDIKFHRWLANFLQIDDDLLCLVPRDHLKSTWLKLDLVRQILNNSYVRIGLFSVSAGLGRDQLKDIKNTLMNPMLRRLFPDILPPRDKWEKDDRDTLTILRPDKNLILQGPQITVRGTGGTITGHHVDIAYLDDIIDPSTVTTPEQMKKSEDWWAYIQSVVENSGIIKVVGTHYHYNDLYSLMIKNKHFDKKRIVRRPAIENGKVIYSSWYTKKDLGQIRLRNSSYIFSCQYMLNPIPKEDQIFPPPQPTFIPPIPKDEKGYKYYITLDPAATIKSYSDETGMIIAAVNHLKQIWIVEAIGMKKKGNEIADILIRKCVQYKPEKVGIEFGLQTALQYIIEQRKDAYQIQNQIEVPLYIEPIQVSNKMSKGARVNHTLGAFIRARTVFISEYCRELLAEMEHFTGKGKEKDNLVDAASMLFQLIDGFSFRYFKPKNFGPKTYGEMFDRLFKEQEKGYSWRKEFIA